MPSRLVSPSWYAAIVSAVALAALTLAAWSGALDDRDRWLRDLARPHDIWGPAQLRAEQLVGWLEPMMVGSALIVVTATICLIRRSLRPAVLVVAAAAPSACVTLLLKFALARPDPHAGMAGHGGSFPSGHSIAVLVCLGTMIDVAAPRAAGWWCWLVGGAGGVLMGTALVVEGMHWTSDVIGGLLLAVTMLAVCRATGLVAWSAVTPRRCAEEPPDGP